MPKNAKQTAFARQCQDMHRYVASLIARADRQEALQPDELLANLNSLIDEICVAGEALAQEAEELTKMRDEVEGQRQHYEELFELAPDGYLVTANDTKICDSNPAAATMLGMSKNQVLDKPLSMFVSRADKKSFNNRLSELIDHKQSRAQTWEMEIQPQKRRRFQAEITAKCCLDASGNVSQLRWLIRDVSTFKKLEQQRQWLLERLTSAHEEERTRIARDLHDKMAQHLTALIIGLKSLGVAGSANPSVWQQVQKLQRIAEDTSAEVHQIAKELRPAAPDDLGLSGAVANFVHEWSERTGISVSLYGSGFREGQAPLSPDINIAVYRIIQQSLINIQKHANASHASVVLDKRNDELLAIVEDNGVGFHVENAMHHGAGRTSLGLIGMRERAMLVGGTLEIESNPGGGTTVFVRVPLTAKTEEQL